MRSFVCSCGKRHILADVNRCPYCNKDLANHTDDYARKHMVRCSRSVNPRTYSDRGPGRPGRRDVEESQVPFVRHCRNCGTAHCPGCDEGICDDWAVKHLSRCPFCGRMPVEVEAHGTYAIICDECNLKMEDDDRDRLLTRWNRA